VPGCAQIGKRLALGLRFLHAILAKIAKACFKCRSNQLRRVRLGNGHQPHILTPASAAPAGSGDSIFNPGDILSNLPDHLSQWT
jgi:hypothetical protein